MGAQLVAKLKDLPEALKKVERQLLTAVAQMQSNVAGGIAVKLLTLSLIHI